MRYLVELKSDKQHSLLSNMAVLAKQKYEENAKELRDAAETEQRPNAKHHYIQLAEIFEDQAKLAAEIVELIDEAEER